MADGERLVSEVGDQGIGIGDPGAQRASESRSRAFAAGSVIARQDGAPSIGEKVGRGVVRGQRRGGGLGHAAAVPVEEKPALPKDQERQEQFGRQIQNEAEPGILEQAGDAEQSHRARQEENGGRTNHAAEGRAERRPPPKRGAMPGKRNGGAVGGGDGIVRQHGVRSFESVTRTRPQDG